MSGSTAKAERRLTARIIGKAGLDEIDQHKAALRHHTVSIQECADRVLACENEIENQRKQLATLKALLSEQQTRLTTAPVLVAQTFGARLRWLFGR